MNGEQLPLFGVQAPPPPRRRGQRQRTPRGGWRCAVDPQWAQFGAVRRQKSGGYTLSYCGEARAAIARALACAPSVRGLVEVDPLAGQVALALAVPEGLVRAVLERMAADGQVPPIKVLDDAWFLELVSGGA